MCAWIRLLQGNNATDGSYDTIPPSLLMAPVFEEQEQYDPWRLDFWNNEKNEPPLSPTRQPTQHMHMNHTTNVTVLKGPHEAGLRANFFDTVHR